MVRWHLKSKRTPRGALVKKSAKKMKFQRGSEMLEARIQKKKVKFERMRGGKLKAKLLSIDYVNIADKKTGKTHKAKIITVQENAANVHFVRRNVITKGAVLKTDAGIVKVTSRPGQDGTVNAVVVEEKKSSK